MVRASVQDLLSGYKRAVAITTHDTNELTEIPDAIWVGGAGHLDVILDQDTSVVVFSAVPAGTLLPLRAKVVKTASTASLMLALYKKAS